MTIDQDRIVTARTDSYNAPESLIDRIANGEAYAVGFGGQGTPWLPTLAELVVDAELQRSFAQTVVASQRLLEPVAAELSMAAPDGFDPLHWVELYEAGDALDEGAGAVSGLPDETALSAATASVPGVLLAQLAAVASLRKQGLDTDEFPPCSVVGHSQGCLAVDAVRVGENLADAPGDGALLALARLIGAAGSVVAARRGLHSAADGSPMLSVTNVVPARIDEVLAAYRADAVDGERGLPVVALRNSRRGVVLSGAPVHLAAVQARCEQIAAQEADDRKRKLVGGAPFAPTFDPLTVSVAFHHPEMADAVDLVEQWAQRCGLDASWARRQAAAVLVDPVDWVSIVGEVVADGAKWILDLGPSDTVTRLSSSLVRGTGVGVIPAALRGGQRNLFAPGGVPDVARAWDRYAPRLAVLPDGRSVIDTAFTRLTGRSPMLLAGMTPTTVDPAIVAAAANAGHWAELAGGGQVTEEIFADNVERLTALLEPGRQAQFNALYLDPYLWKLQLGGKRLVQKARAQGAPIDGVIVSAGIPELEDAVALVDELVEAGLHYVAFKPGTVSQIRDVVRIAAEVPHHPVIVQIEGGRAGGHHSWEDLDDLLLATYAELRARANVVICVGGGIGTPERAAEYLSGRWSLAHDYPLMPLDGILVGTAAMATLEATTSPEVKQLLVDTVGCDEWIGAGHAEAGMASGRSQLGADIHEVDNTASRCGRLLDEVAGDADAVAARRDEIIAALAGTAKPYFGDVTTMTYEQWLRRYAELAVGERDTAADWADITWEQRFTEMLQRAEARLHDADTGEIVSIFADGAVTDPHAATDALVSAYPAATVDILHPADVAFFLDLCKTPGKPVNFVPVVDGDVRRWWRSDSLWQAHDARYGADEVCIIPGPVAVAGITRVDEPVGALLDRFESGLVDELTAAGEPALEIDARRRELAGTAGPIATILASTDVCWADRIVASPVRALGNPGLWEIVDGDLAEHAPSGALLRRAVGQDRFDLVVPIAATTTTIPMTLTPAILDGGAPLVGIDGAGEAMTGIVTVAAGGDLATTSLSPSGELTARVSIAWDPDLAADHRGVTTASLPTGLAPEPGIIVPDALVGATWPSVFALIGAARTDEGRPVVEGLLDLVHLDHAIAIDAPIPAQQADLTATAVLRSVTDTGVGRVLAVDVEINDGDTVVATLAERFAIRGRLGAGELADPVRAGGAADDERDATRKFLRSATIVAPRAMTGFALVSGDHNPIHTDANAAALAGLGEPIVHGMWLSAAAQQVVSARDTRRGGAPRAIEGWTIRFLGMVRLGDSVDVRVDRVGLDRGREVVEATMKVDGELVAAATALLAAPLTVYAFPGQGIQRKGMGLDARSRSAAARDVWDRADAHTREALGFSILAVVRDNPTTLVANGTTYHHPDGVLFLTQFTQVAMATLGVAQVAELRESGAFVDDAITAGHSVGEYNALAACAGVLPLEAVLEVVFQRGEAMHHLVPRDAKGNSDYRMAAIRPSQFGLADDDVDDFVGGVGAQVGEFLEVVNLNLRGSQYAIAGTVAGLKALEKEIERRVAEFGGKRAFILVPGIDVPFHSTVLRAGVPAFRERLDELLPAHIDPSILVGHYIPNLVPRLFNLSREFVAEIADLVPSEPLNAVLADFDSWAARPAELTRVVLIELLAWQFASPVRWIETQDLLFGPPSRGGLNVGRFVEVGLKSAPTLAGLATNTLKLDMFAAADAEVLNAERDEAVLLATDEGAEPEAEEAAEADGGAAEAALAADAPAVAAVAAAPAPAAAAGPRPDDLAFAPADAVRAVIAQWTKIRVEQIGAADTIEALCDGVSSRRNQLLLDVGGELGLGAIDGAAEAPLTALGESVNTLARGYRPLGPVLSDAVGEALRRIVGPLGKRPNYLTERITDVWQLGPGWATHASVAVALGTRDGDSVRGGSLGDLADGPIANLAALDAVIDRAVTAVGAARGIAVALPASGGEAGGTVDVAALGEFTEQLTGRTGVLATAARTVLRQLGLDDAAVFDLDVDDEAAVLADRVAAELGADWVRAVAPAFDDRRAVLLDDRWAGARADLAGLWLTDADDLDAEFTQQTEAFRGAGETVAQHATWWQGKALARGRDVHARVFAEIASLATDPAPGIYADDIAVVTGAADGSIAGAVAAGLLRGGATVIATTSRLNADRLEFFKRLYRGNARYGAALWVVPANLASYTDVDALVEWIGDEQSQTLGGATEVVKPAMRPTLLFPFAAPRVAGDLTDAGARAEAEMKVLLWSVERMIGGLSGLHADHNLDARLHVVLPGSPNRGMFGGDGAYGEAKAALDAVVTRWSAESSWGSRTTLAHALIGWVRGTGLMGGNDPMVAAVEAAGVRTWSTDEMAAELLALCTPQQRTAALQAPLSADLTAGLDPSIDLKALAKAAQADAESAEAPSAKAADAGIPALPHPARAPQDAPVAWPEIGVKPEDLVVIVGAGEVGPYGSARTRFEMEVSGELSAAGVAELAWSTGLITWEENPKPGWYDTASGDPVAESEIWERYHDEVVARCGIRRYADDGAMIDNSSPLLESVFLDEDLTFTVSSEETARAFVASDPEHTRIAEVPDTGEFTVTRLAGTEIRVPRRFELSRTVGGQIPTGFDPVRWGVTPDMASSIDRVALWNLVATVDAFLSSGFTPEELMSWVHPTLVANTQGTGMGGMMSMRSLYVDTLLGESKANDILQEALPNVVAAHVVQSYIGSYGSMIHPVAACATAAVSVEEGADKIRLGKALFAVAGGFDDLGIEGIVGFGDMSATADSAAMAARGIDERRYSRANDRRRGGFVESQGGGTVLLARGDVAAQMGLPVLGVVAFAQSFGDGVHTSIPAPGIGALGAARGAEQSPLARSLRELGVSPDDVAVVSKHDTSTKANDPNESKLHEHLAGAIGRGDGAPLFVVSQKALTGHAKGGAAAFQLIGLCQVLASGSIPPNRSLDCVDDALAVYDHLVWPTSTLEMGGNFELKAGLLTSLGFGHVSGLIAVVHPEAFIASLPADEREAYRARRGERLRDGQQRILAAMCGGDPAYARPSGRRFDDEAAQTETAQEAALLLDADARLDAQGAYRQGCQL